MDKYISIIKNFGNFAGRILDAVVFVLVFSSIWLFCYLVFLRYVLGMAYDWGDLMLQAMIVTGMVLSAAGASKEDMHTAIDFLPLKLKGQKKAILFIVHHFITLLVCGVMVYSGIEIVIILKAKALSSATSVAIPPWILYSVLPISIFFCGIYYLEKLLENLRQLTSKKNKTVWNDRPQVVEQEKDLLGHG